MNPIAMALLVGGLNLLFAFSAFRRLSLLAAGAPARPLDRIWERLTLAPGDRGSSLGGSLLVSVALVSLMAAPAALLGGFAGGEVGRSFLLLGGTLGGLGGGLALFWALRAQIKMPKYRLAGLAHYGIFLGFAVLTLRTVVLVGRGFDESFNLFVLDPFHRDPFIRLAGFGYNILKDIVVVTVLFGVSTFIRFRMQKVKRLAYGWHAWVVLGVIATMMLSDVLYDGGHMLMHALRAGGDTGTAIATYGSTSGETLGRIVATVLHALGVQSPETAHAIGAVGFWTHVFLVFAFLNYLPYGKHFHVITSLPNVLLRNLDPPGRLEKMADTADALVEKMAAAMEAPDPGSVAIGVARLDHFSWKSILDFYTCTECGRCSDNCPAHTTGKLLSPKHLTIDLRDYAYEKQDAVFHANSYTDEGETPKPIFGDNLVPDIIHPDVIWACTTCRACEEQCPVMISYVDKIVDMRRNLVMVRGEFPAELQKTFQALETNGNPWNITRMDRGAWSDGLDVPLMSDKPDAEVLYWVGCAGSYDDRAKKIARATVRLFREANVNFAILGSEETCTGDPRAPRRQRAPLHDARRAERRDPQQLQAEEDRHDLSALLQHAAQRVPRLRRPLRGGAPHRLPPGAPGRGAAQAHPGRQGPGGLPRLVLPRALQRRVRRAPQGAPEHPRRRARRGRAEPRQGPLLRRRRRPDVDGGAAQRRAGQQPPHAPALEARAQHDRLGLPLLPDDAHRRHQEHGGHPQAPRRAARRGRGARALGGVYPRRQGRPQGRRSRRRSHGLSALPSRLLGTRRVWYRARVASDPSR
jgi:heterodisulfide reductase subunit C